MAVGATALGSEQAQFYLAGPIATDQLGLQFWGRTLQRTEDDIFNAPSSTGVMGSDEYNLSGRLAWTPTPDHEILLQTDISRIERESTAGKTVADNGRSVRNDHSRDSLSLSWNGRWDWGTSALSVMREEAQRETWTADATGVLSRGARAPEITNTIYDALFHVPLEGSRFGDHNLVFGGQVIENSLHDINPGERDNIAKTFEVWQRALFVEDEWSLTDDLALTLANRSDAAVDEHWSNESVRGCVGFRRFWVQPPMPRFLLISPSPLWDADFAGLMEADGSAVTRAPPTAIATSAENRWR